ncbi:Quinolinate synthetase (EC [Olavius algarvensis associated proteobacterium Delta 3]|nr:Quinolinate synthetase (EC [Olavius algarvensis associated proteobacterium Delta 3]CAB5166296.1 Quinolinate synthetase (EC [Olavius algarvensis associated proteobacterium Delta 3]
MMKDNIRDLLKEKHGILLAHNYQPPEIQDVADLCGDSLELSVRAAQTDAEVIVFCGVHFMAETAFILSPDKTVLLPRSDAGCPMADMVTPEALKALLKQLPPMPVVTYVNSTAAVKALSTICCTSANAVEVVESLEAEEVLMVPDQNLANYVADRTKTHIHPWEGYCPIHHSLTPKDVQQAKESHPKAVFLAHPECPREILELADVIASTSGMVRYAGASDSDEFIIGTEVGLLYPLQSQNPEKRFYPASERMVCPDMKKISLEDVARSLETFDGEVKVPEDVRLPALKAVQAMIDLAL